MFWLSLHFLHQQPEIFGQLLGFKRWKSTMQSVFFGWVVGKIPAVCRLITCGNAHRYIYIYYVITFILTWCWYIYHTHVREYIFVHLTQGAYIGDSGTCNLRLLAIRLSFPKGWTGQCDEATQDFGGGKWFMLMLGVFLGGAYGMNPPFPKKMTVFQNGWFRIPNGRPNL